VALCESRTKGGLAFYRTDNNLVFDSVTLTFELWPSKWMDM